MSTASSIQCITCDNPSAMTLRGTNTYVIASPSGAEMVIVDPGPSDHPEHLERVRAAIGDACVTQILVTHRHNDHTGAALRFSEIFAAPVRGFSAEQCRAAKGSQDGSVSPLTDGEVISLGKLSLTVLHTPGHTYDSVCFLVQQPGRRAQVEQAAQTEQDDPAEAMLTGDTILGEGTSMLDHPDGTLTDYLQSLRRLSGFAAARLLPAHGPEQPSVAAAAEKYRLHRLQRLDQVRALLAEHGGEDSQMSAESLGELIYGQRSGLPAGITTKIAAAQLDHLRHLGELDATT